MNMAKFLKVILFLLFTVAFYGVVNDFSASKVEQEDFVLAVDEATQGSIVSQAEWRYLPEAELLGGSVPTHQITTSRLLRIHMIQYSLSLKELAQSLVSREAALSQHQGRIYTTTTSYYCHPASQYYVFALRRIII